MDCTESVAVSAGTLAQNGLKVGGVKYMVIAGEPGAVHRGKKGAGEGWPAAFDRLSVITSKPNMHVWPDNSGHQYLPVDAVVRVYSCSGMALASGTGWDWPLGLTEPEL